MASDLVRAGACFAVAGSALALHGTMIQINLWITQKVLDDIDLPLFATFGRIRTRDFLAVMVLGVRARWTRQWLSRQVQGGEDFRGTTLRSLEVFSNFRAWIVLSMAAFALLVSTVFGAVDTFRS